MYEVPIFLKEFHELEWKGTCQSYHEEDEVSDYMNYFGHEAKLKNYTTANLRNLWKRSQGV